MPLPMERVDRNAIVSMYIDGEPCVAIAAVGKGAGVYFRHAVTLGEVRSLPHKENVQCLCINDSGTKLFFGTKSGGSIGCCFRIGTDLSLLNL